MRGRRIAVLVGEFGFLAGSIGRAAADRIVAGIERATREGLPLVAAPVSGGTRMQEGTPAFVQMVRISAAVAAHRSRGPSLPRLPAPPDHRRRDGVVGLARPRHRRRAGRARRLPRAPGLRGALRQAVPRGRADLGEPLRPRHHRRRPAARGDRRHPRPRAQHPAWPPGGRRPGRRPGQDDVPDVDAWDCVTRSRRPDRPGRTTAAAYAATDVVPAQRHRAGRVRPRAADRARALRRGAVRASSARTGAARPPTTRWDPRRCARPGAGCGWRPSSGCRW